VTVLLLIDDPVSLLPLPDSTRVSRLKIWELGLLPEEVEQEVEQDRIVDDGSGGALTDAEKARVMRDGPVPLDVENCE
jgi:hypothetical protein